MNNKNNIVICSKYLFADIDKVQRLLPAQQEMLLRVRSAYNMWNEYPSKKPKEIIQFITASTGVDHATAWRDTKIIQEMMGDFNKSSKDWHRFKFNTMVMKAYEIAEIKQDPDAMQKAANTYAKYNQLDKEDTQAIPWDEIIPQLFIPTEDPAVIGIKEIPNVKQRIKEMLEKYGNDIQDVTFDEIDVKQLTDYAAE